MREGAENVGSGTPGEEGTGSGAGERLEDCSGSQGVRNAVDAGPEHGTAKLHEDPATTVPDVSRKPRRLRFAVDSLFGGETPSRVPLFPFPSFSVTLSYAFPVSLLMKASLSCSRSSLFRILPVGVLGISSVEMRTVGILWFSICSLQYV